MLAVAVGISKLLGVLTSYNMCADPIYQLQMRGGQMHMLNAHLAHSPNVFPPLCNAKPVR